MNKTLLLDNLFVLYRKAPSEFDGGDIKYFASIQDAQLKKESIISYNDFVNLFIDFTKSGMGNDLTYFL